MKSKLFVSLILLELLVLAVVGQASLHDLETVKRGLILLAAAAILFALLLIFQSIQTRPRRCAPISLPPLPPLLNLLGRQRAYLAVA